MFLSLTITLVDADNTVNPDRGEVSHSEDQQCATSDHQENWKTTVSSTAKLLLCTVRDSADVFPPLKSVVGGLCYILENYEVWLTPYKLPEPRHLESS